MNAKQDAEVTLEVELDGAQYKMDMMRLAVEDSMFVEESYAASQAIIKISSNDSDDSSSRIHKLKSLINLVQSRGVDNDKR